MCLTEVLCCIFVYVIVLQGLISCVTILSIFGGMEQRGIYTQQLHLKILYIVITCNLLSIIIILSAYEFHLTFFFSCENLIQ